MVAQVRQQAPRLVAQGALAVRALVLAAALVVVVGLLQRDMPYREIHRQTGVSVTTIGRVARYLAAGNGGYALAARRLQER